MVKFSLKNISCSYSGETGLYGAKDGDSETTMELAYRRPLSYSTGN